MSYYTGRQYTYRYKCPICAKPYAKKAMWVRHIAACEAKETTAARQRISEARTRAAARKKAS